MFLVATPHPIKNPMSYGSEMYWRSVRWFFCLLPNLTWTVIMAAALLSLETPGKRTLWLWSSGTLCYTPLRISEVTTNGCSKIHCTFCSWSFCRRKNTGIPELLHMRVVNGLGYHAMASVPKDLWSSRMALRSGFCARLPALCAQLPALGSLHHPP
ncbi:hypothetical protein C7974DRAFT_391874 [Boeremia exigua]|uniref:uncharacterized protein n=1 Tax=Boeremia exigua TaxID=749465 RepID=UPI001E8E7161|nr:uncharacterized protein C7974DRAFT_391874 [Boeremia exigua]KAH6632974.1 hypothetical protein C7974DRAFT_391874 [Boeremia exigua]